MYHKHVELSTVGIVYLGTPHQGSDGADHMKTLLDICSLFTASNANVVKDILPTSDFLYLQQQLFQPVSANYPTCFCYETLETRIPGGSTALIVPRESASIMGIPRTEEVAMPSDHIQIAKYTGASDSGFLLLATVLRRMADYGKARCQERWKVHKGIWSESIHD